MESTFASYISSYLKDKYVDSKTKCEKIIVKIL